jgi:hypothetical protein
MVQQVPQDRNGDVVLKEAKCGELGTVAQGRQKCNELGVPEPTVHQAQGLQGVCNSLWQNLEWVRTPKGQWDSSQIQVF